MRSKHSLIVWTILLAILLGSSGAVAQGADGDGIGSAPPPDPDVVDSQMSYQGVLKEDGLPVTGSRDMVFRLYDAYPCIHQVGSDIALSGVAVVDGLFNVKLDVPHSDFDGWERWLQVDVEGTTVVDCQEILPAPYALSLRPGAVISGTTSLVKLNAVTVVGDPPFQLVFNNGVYAEADSSISGGFGLHGNAIATSGNAIGVLGESQSTSGAGVYGSAESESGTTYGVHGRSESSEGTGVYGQASAETGTTRGVKGLAESSDGVGVYGENSSSSGGYGGEFEGYRGVYAHGTGSGEMDLVLAGSSGRIGADPDQTSGDIYLESNDDVRVRLDRDDNDGGAHFYIVDSAGQTIVDVDEDGTTAVDVLEITGGSDLAEPFVIVGEPRSGAVVAIDPERPGQLQVVQEAYDRKVAGCVSGANGIEPGLTMRQADSVADGDVPVALSGRVYCWADAASGPIEPGDLLTTADRPGHAMRVNDYARAQGAVIGKAMSGLAEGTGLVLVLISLQ